MHSVRTLFCICVVLLVANSVQSQWSTDPAVNTPVCTIADVGNFQIVRSCSDGAGGVIIVWGDKRKEKTSTGGDLFAQRLDAGGNPLWTANGVMICDTTGEQNAQCIVSDGAGGAIIAWIDARTGQYTGNVYLQRIDSAGRTLWDRQGKKITTGNNTWFSPAMTTDGAGGVIVAYRYGVDAAGVYAQRVAANGTPLWASGGIAVSPAGYHNYPVLAADDSGGAYIAWSFTRGDGLVNSYIQRLTSSGTKRYASAGVAYHVQAASQGFNRLVPVGQGEVMAGWYDERATNYVRQIYVQRFSWNGTPLLKAGGKPVTDSQIDSYYLYMVPDGAGGVFIAYWASSVLRAIGVKWNGLARWDSSAGTILCSGTGDRYLSDMVLVAPGRAVATWYDYRDYTYENGNCNLYAQSIDTLGHVGWGSNGVAYATAPVDQVSPVIVTTVNEGVIAAWKDNRGGTTSIPAYDVYAQRINSHGALTGARSELPLPGHLLLAQNFPNPFNPTTVVRYELPASIDVKLTVFDLLGRAVAVLVHERQEPGPHSVRFNAKGLASGLYVYRLEAGNQSIQRKMLLVR